jgi:group II intron reverse transcriptase/maturase
MEPEMGNTDGTPNSEDVSTQLTRIAELARQMPGVALKTLAHHIDVRLLREAYRQVRKDGAPGIDGVTAAEYEVKLEERLSDLLNRFKSGTYYAPPVKRSYIPKADGGQRGLGIPTLEDKVLQKAVAMVLGAVYEQDFLSASYGYRPGRGALHALRDLRDTLMEMRGGWVLEVDVKSYFDTVEHPHLRSFLDKRVRDGVIRRMIDKWLKAGVMEDGRVEYPDEGTPQGGVISPLLANIYLHEVLDVWVEADVRPRMKGRIRLFRYADDFVICFEREDDARKVAEVLPKRFARFGLTLHPDKTRLIRYEPPRNDTDGDEPPTFDFLGFTHYWAKSHSGRRVIKRRTIRKRLIRKIKEIWQWCRNNRHEPVEWQRDRLRSRLSGYYNYHGIRCNFEAISCLYREVRHAWRYWLNRRSQRAKMAWARFLELEQKYPLPRPRIVHSWV